ncbi:hypothetical protein [Aneurinibacillus sp. UBA3580]|uniref:hypothetical protein n=1 Tax=Aneurinibacillus sp. UBA3580 TaxID=1946041 RepID=UPI00257F3DEF|nr:hypothetical protein [Aneurinibacillus sp. UBA3580]
MNDNMSVTPQEDSFVTQLLAELDTRVQQYESDTEASVERMRIGDVFLPLLITVLIALGFVLTIK